MFNIGGSAAQFAIGLTNDTGATRAVGDVVAVKIANLSATLGSGAATGYEADLVRVGSGGTAGKDDFNRVATGVVVGKPGSEFAVGEEMMVQIYGPVKAKVRLAAGATSTLYSYLVMANGLVYLAEAAKLDFSAAGTSIEAAQLVRGVVLTAATNTGAAPADILVSVYLKWPSI
jgi:hypothetical protein